MHSIRFKFAAFITLLLAALLIFLNTYPVISFRDIIFREKNGSLTAQAQVISSSLSTLEHLGVENVGEVMKLLDTSGVDRVMVFDELGNLLFDSSSDVFTQELSEIRTALDCKIVFHSVFTDQACVSRCSVPVPIRGSIVGAVLVSEEDVECAEILQNLENRIRTISLITSGITLFLAVLFSRSLLFRIQQLVASMQVVASGDYSYRHEVTGRDELSELGNEFNRLTECLDRNEKQRRRFVSDASHELKTPLAAIRLLTDSIVQTEDMDRETMREFVADISNESQRLQRTTEELLDLSRLDDDVQVVPVPVDVEPVITDVLSVLTPLARDKAVAFQCSLEDGCVVMATVDDMFHIVFNLVENAIKYNVPGGKVMILLKALPDQIRLTVSDTGIGIPPEDRINIFSRFYRVDKARSREAGGSGLGLSIVHDAVALHGGTIAVGENKPQGTVFIVSFPRPTSKETGI